MLKSVFIESMNQPITNWLNLNYVASKDSSIPRYLIYQHYCEDFRKEGIEPLNTAMFGKVIKMAFPFIKSRRLGNRGNSKYHYFGVAPRSTTGQMHIAIEDSEAERGFVRGYRALHEGIFGSVTGGNFSQAYKEMKKFWGAPGNSISQTKQLGASCASVEKEFFLRLADFFFRPRSGGIDEEKLFAVKRISKNLVLMVKNSLSSMPTKLSQVRMDNYFRCVSGLNSLANLNRAATLLEAEHAERRTLDAAVAKLASKAYAFREPVSVSKSMLLHEDALLLMSHYIASPSFEEFLCSLDDVVFSAILKKEKFSLEELSSQFVHLLLEVIPACRPSPRIVFVLCSFFSEYFRILSSGLISGPLFKESDSGIQAEGKQARPRKSFVSQIITQC